MKSHYKIIVTFSISIFLFISVSFPVSSVTSTIESATVKNIFEFEISQYNLLMLGFDVDPRIKSAADVNVKKVPVGINFIHPYTRTLFDFNLIPPAPF